MGGKATSDRLLLSLEYDALAVTMNLWTVEHNYKVRVRLISCSQEGYFHDLGTSHHPQDHLIYAPTIFSNWGT